MNRLFLFCAAAALLTACASDEAREAEWAEACIKAGPEGSLAHTQCMDRQRDAYYDKLDAMKDEYKARREEEEWREEMERNRRF